jgi:hypothetical protein
MLVSIRKRAITEIVRASTGRKRQAQWRIHKPVAMRKLASIVARRELFVTFAESVLPSAHATVLA